MNECIIECMVERNNNSRVCRRLLFTCVFKRFIDLGVGLGLGMRLELVLGLGLGVGLALGLGWVRFYM